MTKYKLAVLLWFLPLIAAYSTATSNRNVRKESQSRSGGLAYVAQGWSAEDREVFYRTPIGSRIIPYKWVTALEGPSALTKEPFLTEERARSYRLLTDFNEVRNPDNLPVGFTRDVSQDGEFLGITCAACHTGQINFNGSTLRIDGGSTLNNPKPFIYAAYIALAETYLTPTKFERFAKKVLGEKASSSDKLKLRAELRQLFFSGADMGLTSDLGGLYPTEEGIGRLDALGRISNSLLSSEIGDKRNLAVANAPVGYPHLWGTPSFDRTGWNGSMEQPLARNIVEALFVNAAVTLKGDPGNLFKSNVNINNLFLIEQTLKKLEPPRWPEDILGSIDQAKAARGKALYYEHCAACHESKRTAPNEFGKTFIEIKMYELDEIGTDPTAAYNFHKRKVSTGQLSQPPIGLPRSMTAAAALQEITARVAKRKFEELRISPERQNEMNGFRKNVMSAPREYRARDLAGIWATAPYLHNNSVPNLYQLLLPAAQRDKSFYVGSLQYDPKVLGFVTTKSDGAFELKTNITGNSNAGHEFRTAAIRQGVIGRLLTDEERWAIIEYLKTK